jgi:hypothetical protein
MIALSALAALLFSLLVVTTVTYIGYTKLSRHTDSPIVKRVGDAHIIIFLMVALVCFAPWILAYGDVAQTMLGNEIMWQVESVCHNADKSVDFSEVALGHSPEMYEKCVMKLVHLPGWIVSGIAAYALSARSALAIRRVYVHRNT